MELHQEARERLLEAPLSPSLFEALADKLSEYCCETGAQKAELALSYLTDEEEENAEPGFTVDILLRVRTVGMVG
jgi:hypothetical protein